MAVPRSEDVALRVGARLPSELVGERVPQIPSPAGNRSKPPT